MNGTKMLSGTRLASLMAFVVIVIVGVRGTDDYGALETVIQTLGQRVGQLEAIIASYQNQLNELNKLQPSVIFSVQHKDYTFTTTNHVTLILDVVLINRGGGYSSRHGEFTAPLSGLYHVSYRGWSWPKHAGFLHLILNDSSISELPVGDEAHESASSQSLLLHLNQGDILSLYVATSGPIEMMGQDRTTFMGYLIQAD